MKGDGGTSDSPESLQRSQTQGVVRECLALNVAQPEVELTEHLPVPSSPHSGAVPLPRDGDGWAPFAHSAGRRSGRAVASVPLGLPHLYFPFCRMHFLMSFIL